MLGSYWLLLVASLFIASLILHQAPLLLISLLVLLTGGVARLWKRYCLSRVEYRRRLSANRVFFGEEVQLEIEVANRKPLPLPWVQIEDEIPVQVTLLKGSPSGSLNPDRMFLNNFLSLNWYHKVKRRYPIRCRQRGVFTFGPTLICSGDLFGFFRQETKVEQLDYLTVYPKIVPLEKLGIPSKQPLGDIRLRRHIFQDPLLASGVRDYHFGDSLKRIHWKTTARLGRLQTRVFEPTTTIDVGIFLDVRTVKPPLWGSVPERLELAVMAAASISNYAMAAGYRVGLYVNQKSRFSDKLVSIPPSRHPDQLLHILEALAQVQPSETVPIARLVLNEGRNLPWGSSLVVITAMPTDGLFSTLIKMKKAGRKVTLISVGDSEPLISEDGLTVYHIRDDVMWQEMETLRMEGK